MGSTRDLEMSCLGRLTCSNYTSANKNHGKQNWTNIAIQYLKKYQQPCLENLKEQEKAIPPNFLMS